MSDKDIWLAKVSSTLLALDCVCKIECERAKVGKNEWYAGRIASLLEQLENLNKENPK